MTKDELSHIMARTIKGDFVDFTECANEVFKEVEKLQAENEGLKELITLEYKIGVLNSTELQRIDELRGKLVTKTKYYD